MASLTLKVEADDIVLQELSGSQSIRLELGRQAFVGMWNDYKFKVKTFQESSVVYTRFLDDRGSAVGWCILSPPGTREGGRLILL